MKESRYWLNSELKTTLVQEGLVDAGFGTTGLLRLAAATGLKVDYGRYTPGPQERNAAGARRSARTTSSWRAATTRRRSCFAMQRGSSTESTAWLASTTSLPRRDLADDTEQRLLLDAMLRIFDKGWIAFHGDAAWYLFDDVKHAIRNASEKVLAAVQSCNAELLAEACGALSRRTQLPLSFRLRRLDPRVPDNVNTLRRSERACAVRPTAKQEAHRYRQ